MRKMVLVLAVLAASGGVARADDATDAQAIGQDESALISAMRHMLADVGDLNRKLEELRVENAKLKGAKPQPSAPH